MKFEIEWTPNMSSFYKYGSTIEFLEANHVKFQNKILSPGVPIVSWDSSINFQSGRTELQLPLLKRGEKYILVFQGTSSPHDSFLIKIDFFDRLGNQIESKTLASKGGGFTYLWSAYSYKISLISAGLNELFFDKLLIMGDYVEREER